MKNLVPEVTGLFDDSLIEAPSGNISRQTGFLELYARAFKSLKRVSVFLSRKPSTL